MGTSGESDPTQGPSLHRDKQTFDDPVRQVGSDVTATFDNSRSNPTEWAGSEALVSTAPDEDAGLDHEEDLNRKARADALDTGIDDADRDDSVLDTDEDVLDDDDVSDDDEALIDENGVKKIR